MKSKTLIFIILIASFLRLYQLDSLPISLFGDEIDVGYHAWSLWSTGRDYMGNFLPTYIKSLAEYRAPLLMYITAPFVGLLGATTLSVRLPVALLGILNVIQIYYLTNLIFAKEKVPSPAKGRAQGGVLNVGLISAFILALTPWHIHYSRAAFESTLLLTLILWGTHWFLKFLQTPKYPYILFTIPYALTFYTYSTANLFVPLFALSLVLINKNKIKSLFPPAIIGFILVLPISYQILFGPAASRFTGISVFTDTRITDVIVTLRTEPWATSSFERLFHNKLTATFAPIATNYLESFSPQFLFIHGDLFNRHSVTTYGELLAITLPFLVLGFIQVIQKKNWLLLSWLLLSPLPSALTREGGMHATRLFLMLPPLIIISAYGFAIFLNVIQNNFPSPAKGRVRERFAIFVLCILILTNFSSYWHYYTTHYRYLSAPIWQYGYEEIFTKLKPRLTSTNRVFINNTHEPSLLRFAFYAQLPPQQFHAFFKGDVPQEAVIPNFNGFRFGDKYNFGRVDKYENLPTLLQPGDIYLGVQLDEIPGDWDWSKTPPEGIKTLDVVRNPRLQPQFYLLTTP